MDETYLNSNTTIVVRFKADGETFSAQRPTEIVAQMTDAFFWERRTIGDHMKNLALQAQAYSGKKCPDDNCWLLLRGLERAGLVEISYISDCDKQEEDAPIDGVEYALTGDKNTPCIANGNSWEESRIEKTTDGDTSKSSLTYDDLLQRSGLQDSKGNNINPFDGLMPDDQIN
tara:strand:- start:6974 stop:7492 length:519 start_codon:yes stop_codon:yes gene_type:complete